MDRAFVAAEEHAQTLSIKTAWGGRERYFLREREVAVDDDHWLVLGGERSDDWLEQQALLLLGLMLAHEPAALVPRMPNDARSARAELERRLRLAADYIDTCHAEPLTLDDMARVACLSRYHFVRHFRALHGLTPYAYLLRKRARVATRLLASGTTDREAVAQQCGFGSRFALARALRKYG